VTAMVSRLATSLRQAPATVTALAALALFVVWATDDAGYPVTHWAPGGLVIAALLALCVGIVGVRWGELSLAVRLALGCLAAYTALWLMAAWPALLLGRSRRLAWPLRGVLAGSAVLLADVALLAQSRGSLYATPLMVVLVFACVPARLRTFTALAPVAAAIAA